MAITLKSITTSTVVRPPRIILLGIEKIGKSSFAAGADDVIFIPVKREEGIDSLEIAKFPPVNSYEELMECLGVLAKEDHKFKNVVIDSASALEPIIWESVCADGKVTSIEKYDGGYGKGYAAALDKWFKIMDALDYLREEKKMGSIIIGHVRVKRFDDPERESYDQYQFDIKDTVSAALYRWADLTGFANTNIEVAREKVGFSGVKKRGELLDGGARFLYTRKTPAHPGGGRDVYGRIPEEIPLDWPSFKAEVDKLLSK
jgi:hypothetical protein